MTTATKEQALQISQNEHIDRAYVRPLLQLIGEPHAMDALAIEKRDAEEALSAAEAKYMDGQYRLTQLDQEAPGAAGDERAAIDAERHDLRYSLEYQPDDIEHAARAVYSAENRITQELLSLGSREESVAYQQGLETEDPDTIDRFNKIKNKLTNLRSVLQQHDVAQAAKQHRDELVNRYSSVSGVEAEYKRRKMADRDAERFPGLVAESQELNSAYVDRQTKRMQKLVKLFGEALEDAENVEALHSGVAGDLSAIVRRGNAPQGFRVSGTPAAKDVDHLRKVEPTLKEIKP